MIEAQQPQPEQSTPYTPAGPADPLIFESFEGVNTATLRPGVDDKQAAWLDGFMPLGPQRNLRTMYGVSAALFTAPVGQIAFFDFGNIGSTPYMIVIRNDGSVVSVNTNTGFAVTLAGAGTISNPSRTTCAIAQWGSQYIQIVAKQTNGYFIYDGDFFYLPGGGAPGGGTMPTAIGGNAIENYQGRVWIANGPTITFGAPGSVIDFSSGSGGGNFTSTDSFLRVGFTQLKQTNGFLYLIADSSINYISGVQTSGSPPVTTFTNQNADPEIGTVWPSTVDVFNRNILFANAFGAHVSYGGAVAKISEMLDGVYNTVTNFGNIVPSAAKAIIFGKKVWILLLPIVDPVNGQQVNKLLCWNGTKAWWATEQDVPLVYIQFQEINSVLTAWGTDGSSVYQLFAQPSTGFKKVAQTKLWDKPGGYQFTKFVSRLWGIVQYYSPLSPAITVSIDNEFGPNTNQATVPSGLLTWFDAAGETITWTDALGGIMTWSSQGAVYSVFTPDAVAQEGVLTGFTVSTNAADMAIVSMMIQDQIAGYRG